ncbi:alpha-1,3-mannosyl-glycoprotein 4-beta-N-acetylglucosaminyltransferase C-like [Brachionichthys hirsutus]|uniref:alpha-1,3-mannosyl-glycoprotein 4-beta-N-acetylglucosaminyltransferase C-like n=1 Tax=Brachionichthys hirsutus TaxID=412623 RepID=UPI003604B35F
MRFQWKKKNTALTVLFLFGGFYVVIKTAFLTAHPEPSPEPVPKNITWKAERLAVKESWVEHGGYLPLGVSYQLLAGAPCTPQKYLTVGMSSVKRMKGSYLISTLQSLFSQSSQEERSSLVVVVLLADFDTSWRVTTVKEIENTFASELDQCQLVVLHVPEDHYPPLTGLKRNFNDAPERVSFRSKQNVDYAFLTLYSAGLSQYYLQLEDDVSAATHFFTKIQMHITEQEAKKATWIMLEFSILGYIGKLYKSAHLPLLARFLFLFYQEMPCDWLMTHFRESMAQKEPILLKPSLFQHMGTFSSFQGIHNKLKDRYFEEEFYANPSAEVYSNMSTYKTHDPKNAWSAGEGFFWGYPPPKGSYLTVVFTEPRVVTEIVVETGDGGKDLLQSAEVELGHDVFAGNQEKSCKAFRSLGTLKNGRFAMQEVNTAPSSASSCLRIQVTEGQSDWVIIRKIRIASKQ